MKQPGAYFPDFLNREDFLLWSEFKERALDNWNAGPPMDGCVGPGHTGRKTFKRGPFIYGASYLGPVLAHGYKNRPNPNPIPVVTWAHLCRPRNRAQIQPTITPGVGLRGWPGYKISKTRRGSPKTDPNLCTASTFLYRIRKLWTPFIRWEDELIWGCIAGQCYLSHMIMTSCPGFFPFFYYISCQKKKKRREQVQC